MKIQLSTIICISCFFIWGCSDNATERSYNPQTIEEIVFEDDAVGKQLIEYINNGGDSIMVLNYTSFAAGSFMINSDEEKELIDLTVVLNSYKDYNISIEGHTNSNGNSISNLELSERRANTVLSFLTNEGVSLDRLRAIGYGESRPRATNDTAEGRALNQRVEIAILE